MADRVERVCSTSNFVSSILYRFNTKNTNTTLSTLATNSASKRKINPLKFKMDNINLKSLIVEFENSGEVKNGGLIGKIINFFVEGKLVIFKCSFLIKKFI